MIRSKAYRGHTLKIVVRITALVMLLLVGSADAVPVKEWTKVFGGVDIDEAYSVQQTLDGGYILVGTTGPKYGGKDHNAWLIKTDKNGNQEWIKTFGGADLDKAYSVQSTSDGGYIIGGETSSYGDGSGDAWLIKTDANGIQQWSKTFNRKSTDRANYVQQTTDGGYIFVGFTGAYQYGDAGGIWLVKTDKNGNQEWNKIFKRDREEYASSVQQTTDGGYIIAGETSSGWYSTSDAWLIKTDKNGSEQWSKTYGGTDYDGARSLLQTPDGGFIFAGSTDSYGAGGSDAWLVKIDANGNQKWTKTYGGTGEDEARFVQATSDGGYILAGETSSYGDGSIDAWLIKTDKNGSEQWSMTFGGTHKRWDTANSVQQTSDGGYILVGTTQSESWDGTDDAWLIKVSSEVSSTPTPTSSVQFDTNGDGAVDIVDALFIAQYTVGLRTLTQIQLVAADVNNDGQVNVVDALFIAQYTVGLRQL